ncbi:MAG: glycosyltransferase family 39 protein [Chitinophagales bacterium]
MRNLFSENGLQYLTFACVIVYIIGLFTCGILDVDASQYASISSEMLHSGEFLQVKHRHVDYLDKPPLLFWLSALSYYLFGETQVAYKLPSFFFTLLGLYACFNLAARLYNKQVASLAVLLLASCQAYFLFNHDIRTDTILAGAVIFATWQLVEYIHTRKWLYFFGGFSGIALAMLAKGPIGVMAPALAIASYLVGKKRWKDFYNPAYLLGLLWVLLLLSPMLWGLYQQYGSEGVKFYFWTQSFGRITGENVWHNDTTPLYFVHTFLWSFLPWVILALGAIVWRLQSYWRTRNHKNSAEILTVGGFLLVFAAMSMSKYKLPHYIFVVYGYAAIFTAAFVVKYLYRHLRKLRIATYAQIGVNLLIWTILILLAVYYFPLHNIYLIVVVSIMALGAVFYTLRGHKFLDRLIFPAAISIIAFNFFLNFHIYPNLLEYQSGTQVANYLTTHRINPKKVYFYKVSSHPLDVGLHTIVQDFDKANVSKTTESIWVYTDEEGAKYFRDDAPVKIKHMWGFDHFAVTRLTKQFLDPKTRRSAITKRYLVEIVLM